MTTDRRRDANRRNAKVSTGPRSAAGRLRSSLNAMRHGLTARTSDGDAPEEVLKLARALAAEQACDVEEALDAARAQHAVMRVRRAAADALNAALATGASGGDGGDAPGEDDCTRAVWNYAKSARKYDDYERKGLSRRKAAFRRMSAT